MTVLAFSYRLAMNLKKRLSQFLEKVECLCAVVCEEDPIPA